MTAGYPFSTFHANPHPRPLLFKERGILLLGEERVRVRRSGQNEMGDNLSAASLTE